MILCPGHPYPMECLSENAEFDPMILIHEYYSVKLLCIFINLKYVQFALLNYSGSQYYHAE